jgi:hypothetical protein
MANPADRMLGEELGPDDNHPMPRGRYAPSTPMGGGSCPLRLLELAGFTGVVVATLAAALVGRCRR